MNGDGILAADEMIALLECLEAPDYVDWSQSDLDKDGKISMSELAHLASSHAKDGEDKDPDSPEAPQDGERKDPDSPEASKDGGHPESAPEQRAEQHVDPPPQAESDP